MENYTSNYSIEDQTYASRKNNNNKDMEKNKKSKFNNIIPVWKQITIFLVGWLGIKILATIISLIIRNVATYPNPYENAEAYENFINNLEGPFEFAVYGILFIALALILGKKALLMIVKDYKKADKIGKGIMYGVIMLAATILYNSFIQIVYPTTINENETGVRSIVKASPFLSFFFVVIFAPFCEETTYRLGLCGVLARKNKWLGILVSAFVFAMIHCALFSMDYNNFDQTEFINELLNIPSYFISGIILAYGYTKEDSLVTSVSAHMTNNLVAYLQNFIVSGVLINGFLK